MTSIYNFFDQQFDKKSVDHLVSATLEDMDDGELFCEHRQSESLSFDDGVIKQSSVSTNQGFGMRAILGERTGFAHSSDLSIQALQQACDTVRTIRQGCNDARTLSTHPTPAPLALYASINPTTDPAFADKVALLQEIDQYIRAHEAKVTQVSLSLAAQQQTVTILRTDGFIVTDVRPLVRLNISVVVSHQGRLEQGSYGMGGRQAYAEFIAKPSWQHAAHEACRQALVNLDAKEAPAGDMPVVLGHGWPGVLLHEAVGHGLEGDFNRKKLSAFSDLRGKQVAAKGVTVIDDGTIAHRRGSLTIDDEGTPTQRTTLIEDGILQGYMHDRLNARLMHTHSTGNGRRESYAHMPMPRMTNTFMMAGTHDKDEMIASVDQGIYAVQFGGGQVDITSGKFVFSATEAYKIEQGKITHPIKGATLIGNGPDILTKISMIGNDLSLDHGVGTCGKDGQSVPVGVGQPSLKIDHLTVGGTDIS
jgi:TldD protein